MFKEVDCYSNLFTHHNFRYGSLPGALTAMLIHARTNSRTKVSRFVDHKGDTIPWHVVRTALSTPKVKNAIGANIKTELTPEGMIFYKWGQLKHAKILDSELLD